MATCSGEFGNMYLYDGAWGLTIDKGNRKKCSDPVWTHTLYFMACACFPGSAVLVVVGKYLPFHLLRIIDGTNSHHIV